MALGNNSATMLLGNNANYALVTPQYLQRASTSFHPTRSHFTPTYSHCTHLPLHSFAPQDQAPATKMYNWNMLVPALKRNQVDLDHDMKSLIVEGDHELLIQFLEEFQAIVEEGAGPRPPPVPPPSDPVPVRKGHKAGNRTSTGREPKGRSGGRSSRNAPPGQAVRLQYHLLLLLLLLP